MQKYIVQKIVKASSAEEAIRISRKAPVSECFVQEPTAREKAPQLPTPELIGFSINTERDNFE